MVKLMLIVLIKYQLIRMMGCFRTLIRLDSQSTAECLLVMPINLTS